MKRAALLGVCIASSLVEFSAYPFALHELPLPTSQSLQTQVNSFRFPQNRVFPQFKAYSPQEKPPKKVVPARRSARRSARRQVPPPFNRPRGNQPPWKVSPPSPKEKPSVTPSSHEVPPPFNRAPGNQPPWKVSPPSPKEKPSATLPPPQVPSVPVRPQKALLPPWMVPSSSEKTNPSVASSHLRGSPVQATSPPSLPSSRLPFPAKNFQPNNTAVSSASIPMATQQKKAKLLGNIEKKLFQTKVLSQDEKNFMQSMITQWKEIAPSMAVPSTKEIPSENETKVPSSENTASIPEKQEMVPVKETKPLLGPGTAPAPATAPVPAKPEVPATAPVLPTETAPVQETAPVPATVSNITPNTNTLSKLQEMEKADEEMITKEDQETAKV